MAINSIIGQGTCVKATFEYGHIDRAPLGDIETTLMVLFTGHADKDICFHHRVGNREFELDSRDLQSAEIDLTSSPGMAVLREAIRKGEAGLPTVAASPKVD